jgi:protein-S-isoprenylcysteine O-methyltransferase Ste14
MPQAVRQSLIALSVLFVLVAAYYRIRSQRTGERLDRTKEGWPILIGLRLAGLAAFGSIFAWFFRPDWFQSFVAPVPEAFRWIGVCAYACSVAWLLWMFHALGRNLTDTVVTRRDATFVDRGPYRFVRNPMYTGVLMLGASFGLSTGTWVTPLLAAAVFALMAVRTRTEEKYLIERFGDRYRDYMSRVGRFIPKMTR